jgi:hypothetical protein
MRFGRWKRKGTGNNVHLFGDKQKIKDRLSSGWSRVLDVPILPLTSTFEEEGCASLNLQLEILLELKKHATQR